NHRSRYRKWQDKIAYLLLGLSLLLYFVEVKLFIVLGIVLLGTMQLVDYYFTKRAWFAARRRSGMHKETVSLSFSEDQIKLSSRHSDSVHQWTFFQQAIETPKGLFLVPVNGISIYLPKSVFADEREVKWMLAKIQTANTQV
ncbi:MAG: YcxB family protein, partial [Bacteroidota bacterium]